MEGLSLVIPAHNSERVIEDSLKKYYDAFSKKFKNFEMIVVCNDCWDNTESVCNNLKTQLPVRTICIDQRGKGRALISGLNQARYSILGFLDADNPFDLNGLIKLIDHLKECDVAIVSKYKKGHKKKQEFLIRRMLSLGGNAFSKYILGLNYRDTQAGAKFFKQEVWKKIRKNEKNSGFICIGFDWDMEFLYKIKKNHFRVAEVYMYTNPEEFSTFRSKYLPGMLMRLIRLRFF